MKKLFLLILLVSLTSIGFSQKDTTNKYVILTETVAKKVVKDLISKDSLNDEVKFKDTLITFYKKKISNKDSIITHKDNVIDFYIDRDSLSTREIKLLYNDIDGLNKTIKRKKVYNTLAIIGLVILFLVK